MGRHASIFECYPKAQLGFWRAWGMPIISPWFAECPCLFVESLCLVPPLLTEDFTQRPSGGVRDSTRELLSPHALAHTFTFPSLHTNTHII